MKNSGTRLIAFLITFAFVGEICAGVVATPAQVNAGYVTRWNKVAQNWPKAHGEKHIEQYFQTLEISFNPQFEREDSAYFKTTLAQVDELPVLEKTEQGVAASLSSNPAAKLELVYLGGNDFTLNGKNFTYDQTKPLKANVQAIDAMFAATASTHIIDQLLLPQAHALGALAWALIGAVVGVGLYLLVKNWSKITGKAKDAHNTVRDAHRNHRDHVKAKLKD